MPELLPTTRPTDRPRTEILTVEIDQGSTSARNRPAGQTWLVRLRRADRAVILNTGLGRTSAEQLARQINSLIHPEPAAQNPTVH